MSKFPSVFSAGSCGTSGVAGFTNRLDGLDKKVSDLETKVAVLEKKAPGSPIIDPADKKELDTIKKDIGDLKLSCDPKKLTELEAKVTTLRDAVQRAEVKLDDLSVKIDDVDTTSLERAKVNGVAINELSEHVNKSFEQYGLMLDKKDDKIDELDTLIKNIKVTGGNINQAEVETLKTQVTTLQQEVASKASTTRLEGVANTVDRHDRYIFNQINKPPVPPAKDGIDGKDGRDGRDGLDGAVGPVGPAGPQGPAGPEGPMGPIGPQGPAGSEGPIGPAGPMGPAGADADQTEINNIKAQIAKLASSPITQEQLDNLRKTLKQHIHIAWSQYENGLDSSGNSEITKVPDNARWIGIKVSDDATAPTNATEYQWFPTGFQTKFPHIVLSNYADGNNARGVMDTGYDADKPVYMGIAYTTSNIAPGVAERYTWARITGHNHNSNTRLYHWFVFSKYENGIDDKGNPNITDLPENARYMGVRTNDPVANKPTDPQMYVWVKIGVKGPKGDAGVTNFTFLRFSEYPDGESTPGVASFTAKPNTKTKYIGFSFNNPTNTPPREADDYFWYQIPAPVKGDRGDPGPSLYTHIVYSEHANGINIASKKAEFHKDPNPNDSYIGIRLNCPDDTYNLTDSTLYKWFFGRGRAGLSLRMYIGFSNFIDGVDSQNRFAIVQQYTGQRYMFITYNSSSQSPPTRPDAYMVKIDLGQMSGKAGGFTQDEIEGFAANIAANEMAKVDRKVTTLEGRVDALEKRPIGSGAITDLTDITNKLNKFTADITNFTTDVTNNKNRIADLSASDTKNGKSIKDNASNITKLEDADKALGVRIDGLDTQVKAFDNRINNLVLSAGGVDQAEIQTVKDSVTKLREDHKKELDRLQTKKASYSIVDGIRVDIQEVRGEMGVIRTSNQETTDKINIFEQQHNKFITKTAVTSITDPLRTDVDKLKTDVANAKQGASDASSALSLAKVNSNRLDTLGPKFTDYDNKIQNLSDDIAKASIGSGATKQELSDLDKKLSNMVVAVENGIEPKVINYVDKKLKALPSGSNATLEANVTALQKLVEDLTKRIVKLECEKAELKFSQNQDGTSFTDAPTADTQYMGIRKKDSSCPTS